MMKIKILLFVLLPVLGFSQAQSLNDSIALSEIVVTAQLRKESVLDVPISMSVLSKSKLELLNTNNLTDIAGFVPGLEIQVQSTNYPSYSMRGITSELSGASDQPNVSVYFNNIPLTRGSSQVVEPYDMARIEVLKGPQGTLFGRAAQIGAIHFVPNAPKAITEGSISAGISSFNGNQITAIYNTSLTDKLFFRIAARNDQRDGYIKNTFGGDLMGKNTKAARASFRYLASEKTTIDLQVDFQDDDAPGVAFLRKDVPNTKGEFGIFGVDASLEQGEDLTTEKTNLNTNLKVRHNFSDELSLTSISSYFEHSAFERYDSDGTAARAFDATTEVISDQIYQELRLQLAKEKYMLTFGGSYITEDVRTNDIWQWDERAMYMFLLSAPNMVDSSGNPVLPPALPSFMGGLPLSDFHSEGYFVDAKNQATEVFVDGTFDLTQKLSFTAGLRYSQEKLEQTRNNLLLSTNNPSTIGLLIGNYPNGLLPVGDYEKSGTFSGLTGRAILKYTFDNAGNIYGSYSRGRRPNAFGYDSGEDALYELDEETVNSFEIGLKKKFGNTLIGIALFNQDYQNFRVTSVESLSEDGTIEYKEEDIGDAYARGIEVEFEHNFSENIRLIGSYGHIKARYSSNATDGTAQEFAGNRFRLTPDNKFAIGAIANVELGADVLSFKPTYTFKSKHFFDGYNDFDETDPDNMNNPLNHFQPSFGLLNMNLTYHVSKWNAEISVYAQNVLDEEYVIDAGNLGKAINPSATTFIPGSPRIIGSKISFKF